MSSDKGIVYILPIGEVEQEVLEYLKENLADVFPRAIKVLGPQQLPSSAYNPQRRQYHSTAILEKLRHLKPADGERLLGVLDADLYVPQLNFVFGEADPRNGTCLISLIRLRQSFYGLSVDRDLFEKRALKEAVHELGHTWGLGHCKTPKCVMYFSNSLLDTDRKGTRFCPACKSRLRWEP